MDVEVPVELEYTAVRPCNATQMSEGGLQRASRVSLPPLMLRMGVSILKAPPSPVSTETEALSIPRESL
jgi:hypothetical protein